MNIEIGKISDRYTSLAHPTATADCEAVVTSNFCDNCGQALDWSDDK